MAKNYIARQDGMWTVISLTPDVCKTPMGPSTPPVPYQVTASLGNAVQTVSSVRANGRSVLVLDQSFVPATKGDEPGVAKGIKSGTVGDICEPQEHSCTVFAGGKSVLRHFDRFWMNARNTTGIIIGQPPAANIYAAQADPPQPVPETEKEQSLWDRMLAIEMEQHQAQIDAAPVQLDLSIGAAKAFWNQFPDTVTLLGQGAVMQHAGEMQINAVILAASGQEALGRDMYNLGGEVRAHTGDFSLNKFRLEMSNDTQALGGKIYDYGSLAMGGMGLLKGGFSLAKALRAASKLAKEGQHAGKFTADLLELENAQNAASDLKNAEKLTENAIPDGDSGAIINGRAVNEAGTGENAPHRDMTCTGDPVDVASGSLIQALSVLSLPGSLPLTLSRFYRSRSEAGGLFGPKWTDDWSVSLTVRERNVRFTDHEGVVLCYPLPQDGIFHETANGRQPGYRLSGDMRGDLTLFDRRTQQTRVFSPADHGNYLLSAIHDRYGNRIDFLRTDGLLTDIRHSHGYALALDWQQQRLTGIDLVTPQRQRLVTCHYDSYGRLAECDTFQFTHLWHDYSLEGWMTRWRDTAGTCVDMTYDAQGRVTGTRSTAGYYDDHFVYHDDERCTTYLDGEGGETRYWYNEEGLVTRSLDPLGREEVTEWKNTRLQSRTDALGRTTRYRYNDEGDVCLLALPGGRSLYYDYSDLGQLTRLTVPGNQVWRWDYDDQGSMVSLTDPQGLKQRFSYGEQGDLLSRAMPGGATWRWDYDTLHQVREITAPDGGVTQTERDFLGRLLSVKDPLGFTTRFRHSRNHASPRGSVEEIHRPDGVQELLHKDSEKRTESVTDGEGKTTRYEYGAFDLLTAVVRPDGERLTCRYDRLTRLTEITNAAGEHYRLEYDKAGQLIAETDFTGRTLRYEYDGAGRRTATCYPDGSIVHRCYDDADNLLQQQVRQKADDGEKILSVTDFRYDDQHRMIKAKSQDAVVEFEYGTDGQVIAETINGRRVAHSYDPLNGRPFSWTLDNVTAQLTHDLAGRVTAWQVNDHTPLRFSHDALGRETQRASDAGFLHGQYYSPTGHLLEQWAGRHEPGCESWPMDVCRRQEYDRAGNLTRLVDERWGETRYRYDSNDQIILAEGGVRRLPRQERFDYDVNLNIHRQGQTRNLPDAVMQHIGLEQTHGRVTQRGDSRYRYDACGRLVEKTTLTHGFRPQTWRYDWDGEGQLVRIITPQGERWRYSYDAFGRRLSKRREGAARGIAGYDYQWSGDRLVAETPVDADGTAAVESSVYWLYEPGALTPGARYEHGQLHYIVRDHMGTPRELLSESGEVVRAHRLSVWGGAERYRFRHPTDDEDTAPSCPWRFAGQYADEESGLHYNRFRYYDAETGQYVSPDPIGLLGGGNPYSYVQNPLKWIDPLGLCKADIQQLNPNDIRFSQSSVNGAADLTNSMKLNGWKGDPIDVVRMADGKLTTVDNTRVLAASRAGVKVDARIHDASEALPPEIIGRLTTKRGTPSTWGDAIDLRIGKQSAGYRNQYPDGSVIIGSLD